MYRIQEMMCGCYYEDPDGRTTILPAIIQPKNPSARNCIVPPCQSCLLARAKKRSPNVSQTQPLEDHEGAITRDQYEVGDSVSTDQLICKTPKRLPTGYGRESQDRRFQGGTIYNDAASGLIWVENQVSLGANETVMGKARFKQWLWDQCVSEVNIIMVTIQTIMYMAWTFMVHASLHWTERGSDDLSLWSFAVKHSVWIYNHVPNAWSGLTPLKLVTKEHPTTWKSSAVMCGDARCMF